MVSDMAYDRYPIERRSNQPQPLSEERQAYSLQPASQTRFYRDKENGKVMGVCAGIADYTGFDVALVRICFLAAVFMSGGSVLPFYFIAGWVAPTKPRELADQRTEDRQFWQGVRASPARAARDIRSRMKDIDRRLADIESYVTTENRSLAREIEQLR
jgi:phage shock protein C